MGWNIHISTARPISMSDAEDIIAIMGPTLVGEQGACRKKWGWACAVDIHNPVEDGWDISGAPFSIATARVMERFLVNALEERGYAPEVTYRSEEVVFFGAESRRESFWLNLRDSVAVKLTPRGQAVWDLLHPEKPHVEGGTLQVPLSVLMETFGPFMDRVNPFVDESLHIERLVK